MTKFVYDPAEVHRYYPAIGLDAVPGETYTLDQAPDDRFTPVKADKADTPTT